MNNAFRILLLALSCAPAALAVAADAPYALAGWQLLGTQTVDDGAAGELRVDTLLRAAAADSEAGTIQAFDAERRAWMVLPALPERRDHAMVAAWGDSVLVFGGMEGEPALHSDDTWMFDRQRGSWTPLSEMPEPRAGGAVVVVDDLFYIVGGTGGSARVLRYDPMQDAWRRLADLGEQRELPAAVALDGHIYVIGGRDGSGRDLDTVLAYEIASDRVEAAPAMTEPRSAHAAVVFDERIVALGGEAMDGSRRLRSIESWQPGESAWRGAGSLPRELVAIAAASAGGHLYVTGDTQRAAPRAPAPVLVTTARPPMPANRQEVQ